MEGKFFIEEPPKGLLEKILMRIRKEERVLVLRRTIIFSVTLMASIIEFMPAFNMLSADFSRSGFLSFFSLMFSDFSSVMPHWKNLAMILLESLPAVSLALFLAIVLVFLQSIKSLLKNIKIISGRNRLIIAR